MNEIYKKWVVEEIVGQPQVARSEAVVVERSESHDLFSNFIKVNKRVNETDAPAKKDLKVDTVSL